MPRLAEDRAPQSLTEKAANEIGLYRKPGLSRASTSYGSGIKKDVDGRDKPGHDEKANHFHAVRKSLKILAAFSVRLSR